MWQTMTREQLYEQVWSVPIWTLCEQYGLSDNGLRKICRRLNVPVPARRLVLSGAGQRSVTGGQTSSPGVVPTRSGRMWRR